ncbi:MAG: hypothetical protein AAB839_02405 [Patescibacteria group bacterium]
MAELTEGARGDVRDDTPRRIFRITPTLEEGVVVTEVEDPEISRLLLQYNYIGDGNVPADLVLRLKDALRDEGLREMTPEEICEFREAHPEHKSPNLSALAKRIIPAAEHVAR